VFTLANESLSVEVLDPARDRDRFGVRYCTGGYIFQVRDVRHGDLLTGPTFPESFNWFDGQGIPDAFNLSPLSSTTILGEGLVIGVGRCDILGRRVLEFCDWRVERAAEQLEFSTVQRYEAHGLELVRRVELLGRTIRSFTRLVNTGPGFVPMRWFPHPFFPHSDGDELLWVNAPLRWKDNADYVRQPNGFIARRGWPWRDGRYLPLDHDATAPLVLLQRHPKLGLVAAACSYVPDFFPIWGNGNTFSWEPFLERLVAPGQSLEWWIDYTF